MRQETEREAKLPVVVKRGHESETVPAHFEDGICKCNVCLAPRAILSRMRPEPFDSPPDDELRRALSEFVRAHRAAKLPVPADGIFIPDAAAGWRSPDSSPDSALNGSGYPAGPRLAGVTPSCGGLKHIQLQSYIAGRWMAVGDLELLPDGTISVSDTPEATRVIKNDRGLFNPALGRFVTPVETALYFETLVKFGSGRTWRAVDYFGSDALPEEPQSAGSGADWWRADSRRW